jgi:hypothetical protein
MVNFTYKMFRDFTLKIKEVIHFPGLDRIAIDLVFKTFISKLGGTLLMVTDKYGNIHF